MLRGFLFSALLCLVAVADGPPPLPAGAEIIQTNPNFIIYRDPSRPEGQQQRLLFRASTAWLASQPLANQNKSVGTRVRIIRTSEGDFPLVYEGLHRTAGAARGDVIPAVAGGTTEPGWLDFHITTGSPMRVDNPGDIPGLIRSTNVPAELCGAAYSLLPRRAVIGR